MRRNHEGGGLLGLGTRGQGSRAWAGVMTRALGLSLISTVSDFGFAKQRTYEALIL